MASKKPDPVEIVGRRIRAFRTAQGMTVEQLAAATGLSGGHLSKLERGLQVPTVKTLAALADAFGVEAVDLLTEPTESVRHGVIEATATMGASELEELSRSLRRSRYRVIEGDGRDSPPSRKGRRVSRRRRKKVSRSEVQGGSSSGTQ